MTGETNLTKLIQNMNPILNDGNYVFCTVSDLSNIPMDSVIGTFREAEGTTIILAKAEADKLNLAYEYIAAWITLEVHSALEAVGLTAAFATALGNNGISANVVAGYYHDHIFVAEKDKEKAMEVLRNMG
jgi:hypothetical protein